MKQWRTLLRAERTAFFHLPPHISQQAARSPCGNFGYAEGLSGKDTHLKVQLKRLPVQPEACTLDTFDTLQCSHGHARRNSVGSFASDSAFVARECVTCQPAKRKVDRFMVGGWDVHPPHLSCTFAEGE
jgi:hypothetical protein